MFLLTPILIHTGWQHGQPSVLTQSPGLKSTQATWNHSATTLECQAVAGGCWILSRRSQSGVVQPNIIIFIVWRGMKDIDIYRIIKVVTSLELHITMLAIITSRGSPVYTSCTGRGGLGPVMPSWRREERNDSSKNCFINRPVQSFQFSFQARQENTRDNLLDAAVALYSCQPNSAGNFTTNNDSSSSSLCPVWDVMLAPPHPALDWLAWCPTSCWTY